LKRTTRANFIMIFSDLNDHRHNRRRAVESIIIIIIHFREISLMYARIIDVMIESNDVLYNREISIGTVTSN